MSEVVLEEHRRKIRSFVKREGRLNPRIQRVWDELSSRFVAEQFSEISFGQGREDLPLVVEIGSGQGNQIVHAAAANPEKNFLALEVYHTGAAHTLLLMRNAGVENVRIMEADASELFESGELEDKVWELWTFFPDPWPKKRHNKRRLVGPDFAALAFKQLRAGGIWRLATDWEDYANQMAEVLFAKPSERFEGRLLTNFELKGIAAGRKIFDFAVCARSEATSPDSPTSADLQTSAEEATSADLEKARPSE